MYCILQVNQGCLGAGQLSGQSWALFVQRLSPCCSGSEFEFKLWPFAACHYPSLSVFLSPHFHYSSAATIQYRFKKPQIIFKKKKKIRVVKQPSIQHTLQILVCLAYIYITQFMFKRQHKFYYLRVISSLGEAMQSRLGGLL